MKRRSPAWRGWLPMLGALLLAPAAGRASPFSDQPPTNPPQLAIWCEFLPYAQVEVWLPVLAQYRCALLLHVSRGDLGRPELAQLCRAARAQGVEVQAWFLLPYEEHLYVGEATVDQIRDLALAFVRWAKAEQLGIDWVIFDCEPSPLLGGKLFAAVRKGRVLRLRDLLRGEKNPAQFRESIARLNALIDELHGQGVKVMGAGNRVFLDFLEHGNTTIQDALDAPFTMIRWDRASFITYRYRASQETYMGMVQRYGRLAHRYFGDRAALDLGLLGDHRHIPEQVRRAELFGAGRHFMGYLDGMRSVFDLQEAISMARGAGVDRINLYSLDGAVDSVAGLDYWLHAAVDSRPLRGWRGWMPVKTVRLEIMALGLEGLFRGFVGRSEGSEMGKPAGGEAETK